MLSSRKIERACVTDVAFRVACAQDVPDHSTVSRFRKDHEAAFTDFFEQVLMLCARAGMGDFSTVAVDGTKIQANASAGANRRESWLRQQAEDLVAAAASADEAEDAAEAEREEREGPADPDWQDPGRRMAKIRQALEEIQAHQAEMDAQARAPRVTKAEARVANAQATLDQGMARIQARNDAAAAQIAAGTRSREWRPIVPAADHAVVRGWKKALERQLGLLAQAMVSGRKPSSRTEAEPRGNLTDPQSRWIKGPKGFIQGYNAQLAVAGDGLILAALLTRTSPDFAHFIPMMRTAEQVAQRFSTVPGREDTRVGAMLADAGYCSQANIEEPGPERLIATARSETALKAKAEAAGPTTRSPDGLSAVGKMTHKVAENMGLYRRRAATVEPENGHLKDRRNLRTFSRRGMSAAQSELHFAAAITNLEKLYRHQTLRTA